MIEGWAQRAVQRQAGAVPRSSGWWLLLLTIGIAVLLYGFDVRAQGGGYSLVSGRLEAENGGIECWFNIAAGEDAFGLAPHPKGIPCMRLKEFAGKTGTLFWIPD